MAHMALDTVLSELAALHSDHKQLNAFCAFPGDVTEQQLDPFHIPASDLLQAEQGLGKTLSTDLRDALIDLAPTMHWRETYQKTDIGADFMNRFGCYEIIGRAAPFASAAMRSFLVYQPPHLHYPWHRHPAEEMYVVIAGEAEFHQKGETSQTLQAGQATFHPSMRSHALTSHDHPVLAYVVWRDEFDTAPVWSDR